MENSEIARVLEEVADLLEIAGENFFRIRAYRYAAQAILEYPVPAGALREDQLRQIPNIGADLAAKIAALARDEDLETHRELLARIPKGVLELREIRGLGPRRIKLLIDQLHVHNREDLFRAAAAAQLRTVRGLGRKLEDEILALAAAMSLGSDTPRR